MKSRCCSETLDIGFVRGDFRNDIIMNKKDYIHHGRAETECEQRKCRVDKMKKTYHIQKTA